MKKLFAVLLGLIALGCVASDPDALAAARKGGGSTAPKFSINDVTVVENGQVAELTITKSGVARSSSTINVRTANREAISGTDYSGIDQTVTFSKSTSVVKVYVNITDDQTHEGTETFAVNMSAGSNATIVDGQGIVTITDNDDPTATTKTCPDGTVVPIADSCPATPGTPAPTPEPGTFNSDLANDGDSISVEWSGNYIGMYRTARPSLTIRSFAVGGSTLINLDSRVSNLTTDAKPRVFHVLIGANDATNYASAQAYVDALFTYTNKVKALGSKIIVGTILPQCTSNTTYNAAFETRRAAINVLLRAAVGNEIDAVADYAADPMFDQQSDACNTTNFNTDGVHPAGPGHSRLYSIYAPAIDALVSPGPTPAPMSGWENSPSLNGAADIATNDFSISTSFTTGGAIPISGKPDVVGAFRFICGAGKIGYIDPIVNPGGNAAHLHQFYGNDSVTKDSTYSSLRAAGGSTCNTIGNGSLYAANRSAYWMPAMLVGTSKVLKPDYVSIYYKRRPISDPKCGGLGTVFGAEGKCVNLPNGLKFIFGYDMVSSLAPTGKLWFNCQGVGAVSGKFQTITAAMAGCPQGAQLGAIIEAPDCWDGKNLDSPNHRNHVSYAYYDSNTGQLRCPDTHPYVIPTFTLGAWYTVVADAKTAANAGTLRLSSDDMVSGAAPGTTFHADFFMAWDPAVKKKWHDGCIDQLLNCSAGEMGDGSQLVGAAVPSYGWRNPSPLVDKPAAP